MEIFGINTENFHHRFRFFRHDFDFLSMVLSAFSSEASDPVDIIKTLAAECGMMLTAEQ